MRSCSTVTPLVPHVSLNSLRKNFTFWRWAYAFSWPEKTQNKPNLRLINLFLILFSRNDCIEKKDSPEVFFCCCEGNMCNERFFYFPEMEVTQRKSVQHIYGGTTETWEMLCSMHIFKLFYSGFAARRFLMLLWWSSLCAHIKKA